MFGGLLFSSKTRGLSALGLVSRLLLGGDARLLLSLCERCSLGLLGLGQPGVFRFLRLFGCDALLFSLARLGGGLVLLGFFRALDGEACLFFLCGLCLFCCGDAGFFADPSPGVSPDSPEDSSGRSVASVTAPNYQSTSASAPR